MEAIVNGVPSGTWPFFEQAGVLYASREALDEWRVRVRVNAQPMVVRGAEYWPLAAVPGFSARTSLSASSVELTFSADVFDATKVSPQNAQTMALTPVMPSVFANYELSLAASKTRGAKQARELGALVEIGGSTDLGLMTTSAVGRNLMHGSSGRTGFTRLDTSFTGNWPGSNLTLRLGDSATKPGLWGQVVYFGGVQLGTNFQLTPGFVTQPTAVLNGVSSSPSTVELYVNDVLRQVSQVPTGPFAIDNASALTGSGEARMVVRDLLGREVVITQPFFSSARMLAKDLSDWGAEAGLLRRAYGSSSNRYGPAFVAGTFRHGVTDHLTMEGRVQATREFAAGGLGAIAPLPAGVLGRAVFATSRDTEAGNGFHGLLGADKQWKSSAVYFQAEASTRNFRSLDTDARRPSPRLQWVANFSHSLTARGQFGFAAAGLWSWLGTKITTLSANLSFPLGERGTLSAYASKAFGNSNNISLGVTMTIPLEHNRSMSVVANVAGGQTNVYATAASGPAISGEPGWRVLAGRLANENHAEAGIYYEGRYGTLSSDLGVSSGNTSMRTSVAGGLVFAGASLFATRRVDQSYALVEVKDVPGIGVGTGSNFFTRTDSRGLALVSNLTPYVLNQIRLNEKDLALSTEIDSIEHVVVPPLRGGVKVDFPVRSGRAALLKIVLSDGQAAPAGAVVRIQGGKEEFWVARQGQAYVTGLADTGTLELAWKNRRCQMQVTLPPLKQDDIARLGPVICEGVER